MLVENISNCETIIAKDESVRLQLTLSGEGQDLNIEIDDSQARIILTHCIEHLYESKKDIYAECLHACLQELALYQLGLQDENEWY